MKMKVIAVAAFIIGLMIGQSCSAIVDAHAASSTSDAYRQTIALEKIAQSLQNIEKKIK